MNSEELRVNSEEYKCYAFDVGADALKSAQCSHIIKHLQIKNQNAITLIALIITIIIMLILVGVVLSLTIGEHGIFKTAGQAAEEYEKAKIKEEIELAIMDIQQEEIANGNELTLEKLNEKLPNKLGTTTKNEGNKLTGDYKGHEYEIDSEFNITIKEKVKGIKIDYTLSNNNYTKENIYLTINATSTDGDITNITAPTEITKNADGAYIITKNGNYEFTASDNAGNTKTVNIVINNIDTIAPIQPTIEIENITATKFTVKVKAEDADATEDSAKSGIGKYVYYINEKDQHESEQAEYEFTQLNRSTKYTVNVIAYDKAGNPSKVTQTTLTTTDGSYPTLTSTGWTIPEDGLASDALGELAFDGNMETHAGNTAIDKNNYELASFYVDETVYNKELAIRFSNARLASGGSRVATFRCRDSEGALLNEVSETCVFAGKETIHDIVLKIPEGTEKVNIRLEYGLVIYEVSIKD